MSTKRAPVAVFAFRRLIQLQRTLTTLARCKTFNGGEVTVYSDAAAPGDRMATKEVEQVRRWLRDWCKDRGAHLHEAGESMFLRRSIVSGVTDLVAMHGRVIVLEDDLELSPHFLTFMNDALDAYATRKDIMQVSAYMVPHKGKLPPLGLLRVPGSWGWATWKRAWDHYNDDAPGLLAEIRKRDVAAFDFNRSYAHLEALERNATGKLDTWLVRWYASMFLRGGLSVHPSTSFVRNIGFGEEGTNCKPGPTARTFMTQPIVRSAAKIDWTRIGSSESPEYAAAMESFYRWQHHQWTKPKLRERAVASIGRILPRRKNA